MSMFLVLIAIQACLIVYTNQDPENTLIWQFINGMTTWGTLGFILALVGIAGGIGLVGIAAASVFGFKTDFLIFAPAIAGFISMGVVFTNLARALQDDLIATVFTSCNLTAPFGCTPTNFIIALTIGPVALYYTWTIVEWWRGKDY